MRSRFLGTLGVLAIGISSGCSGGGSGTTPPVFVTAAPSTASPTPAQSASASPTPSPTSSPTPAPSATPSPSPSPTPVATRSVNACAQPQIAASPNAVTIVPFSTFTNTLSAGKLICFSAYVFTSDSFKALDAAAKNGANETVILPQEEQSEDASDANQLAADGAQIIYDQGSSTPPLHAKLAVVDGTAYLDGRNWDSTDVVISDTYAADFTAIENALALSPTSSTNLDTLKSNALTREANMITSAGAGPGTTIRFMTESFSTGASSVISALEAAAQNGATIEVCVLSSYVSGNSSEQNLLTTLKSPPYNMNVRLNPNSGSEKMTLISNETTAWFGSSNATSTSSMASNYIDWGLTVSDPTVITSLQQYYDSTFASSSQY